MNSSDITQKRERTRLLELANEYKSKGYEVFVEPSLGERPEFLKEFQVDLIAIGPTDQVIIEVKTKDSLKDSSYLEKIAQEVEKHKNWRFELVVTNPRKQTDFFEDWALLSLNELNARFEQAQTFVDSSNQLDTALLLLWVVAESALMHIAQQESLNLKRRSPNQLVKELFSLGLLSSGDYRILEEAAQYRNRVVHGFTSETLTYHFFDSFKAVVNKILKDLQV